MKELKQFILASLAMMFIPTFLASALLVPAIADESGRQIIQRAALREGVPVDLALKVAHIESRATCGVRNSTHGAVGIMQVMPGTAATVGIPRSVLQTCEGSATAGVRYLRRAMSARPGAPHQTYIAMYQRGF